MPTIAERSQLTPPQANESHDQALDDLSSDRGGKVWGNSVLSANHDTPIDHWAENNEDLDEIRQIAAISEIKQFLRQNNLETFNVLLEMCCKKNKDLTLKDLAKYDANKISQFLSQQSVYTL